MRMLIVFSLAGAVCLAVSSAQAQALDPALKKALVDSETARLSGNADAWNKYILDDAIFTSEDGGVETKKQRIAKLTRIKTAPPRVSDEKYRTYGDTVIRTWRQDMRDDQGRIYGERRIAVWVKQSGEWKLASLQITRIQ